MTLTKDRCWTCGRARGLAQQRESWSLPLPTVLIPRTDDPADRPAQITNDLIVRVVVYRNGGIASDTHLCDECLRIALREIHVRVSDLLGALDADHDKDAEINTLTQRLASLQHHHHNVCFDHDRMQDRLRAVLPYVANADPESVRTCEWETARGKARESNDG